MADRGVSLSVPTDKNNIKIVCCGLDKNCYHILLLCILTFVGFLAMLSQYVLVAFSEGPVKDMRYT